MHYRVRNADGEIQFPGIAALVRAYEQGLVDADDEVSVDGGPWRKALAVPELRSVMGATSKRSGLSTKRWYLAAGGVALVGIVVLAFLRGWMLAAAVLVLSAALSSWYAYDAMKKRRHR